MDPHSPNKLFATKYCFLILGDEFLFLNHFFIFLFLFFSLSLFFFFFLFYVIFLLLIFTKTMLLLSFYLINFFFLWKLPLFLHVPGCFGMFMDVPECSGMFHVPGFIDAPFIPLFCSRSDFHDDLARKLLPQAGYPCFKELI